MQMNENALFELCSMMNREEAMRLVKYLDKEVIQEDDFLFELKDYVDNEIMETENE